MQQLTNSAGVPIRVRQVWIDDDRDKGKVIATHDGNVWVCYGSCWAITVHPNKLVRLIQDAPHSIDKHDLCPCSKPAVINTSDDVGLCEGCAMSARAQNEQPTELAPIEPLDPWTSMIDRLAFDKISELVEALNAIIERLNKGGE